MIVEENCYIDDKDIICVNDERNHQHEEPKQNLYKCFINQKIKTIIQIMSFNFLIWLYKTLKIYLFWICWW